LHRGQRCFVSSVLEALAAGAPQWEQNFAPRNIIPKQAGQAIVARREPQCWQFAASARADAPHIGQFNVSALMIRSLLKNSAGGEAAKSVPPGQETILFSGADI
jgi:hypothetical protein